MHFKHNAQTAELLPEALLFADYARETPSVPPIPNHGLRNSTAPPRTAEAYRNRIRDGPTTVSRPVRSISSTSRSRSRTNAMTAPRPEVSGRNKTTPACW